MRSFEEDMEAAAAYHGHLCSGIVLGVRMARLGSQLLGIDDPLNYRDLVVYIEIDRCATDAIYAVTHCTMGRRRLKFIDHGKLAATFVDLATDKAVRLAVISEHFPPEDGDLMQFWSAIPDEEMFKIQQVVKIVPPEDRPGKPLRSTTCQDCGEKVMDGRDVTVAGRTLCRGCASSNRDGGRMVEIINKQIRKGHDTAA